MKPIRFEASVEDSLAERIKAAEKQMSLKTPQIFVLLAGRYLDDLLLWHSGSAPTPPAIPPPPMAEYTEENLPPITL